MPKKVKYPIHKSGKFCGYDEYEDGSIEIAPQYQEMWNKREEEKAALEALIKSVIAQAHILMIPLENRRKTWWEKVREDYNLPNNCSYSAWNGKIEIEKEEKKD